VTGAPALELDVILTGIRFGLDDISRVFLAFTALLWLICGAYAHFYLKGDRARTRFFSFYLASMAGNVGLILAQDMVSFYLCFALMTFTAYPLVIHDGTPEARRAGTVYIVLAVIGEALIVSALILIASEAEGTGFRDIAGAVPASRHRDLVVALVLAGFGIKAGAIPLHVWLPLAHPVAPTPASAVLSGVIIKAGLLGWIRFLPLGEAALPGFGMLCMVVGLAGAFYGVLVGVAQDNPKTVLAYSSISQMGLMLVAIGTGLAWPQAWGAAAGAVLIYSLHHALNKGALFLGVGVAGSGTVFLGRGLVTAGLLLPALALAGAPFTSGAAAKTALVSLAGDPAVAWPAWVAWGLSLSSMATAVLMARFCFLVLPAGKDQASARSRGCLPAWGILVVLAAAAGWLLPSMLPMAGGTVAVPAGAVLSALWPVIGGAALFVAARHWIRRSVPALRIRIPAGDVLALAEPAACGLCSAWNGLVENAGRLRGSAVERLRRGAGAAARLAAAVTAAETRISRWITAGAAFLFLAVLLFRSMSGIG